MQSPSLESGVVIGFGGTHARIGRYDDGELTTFPSAATPEKPEEFFGWMAKQTLAAIENGDSWLVSGFPGTVSSDGKYVGPMRRISGLSGQSYELAVELARADPAVGRNLKEGFRLVAVTDSTLAAHAAASRLGSDGYKKVAALTIGTGVGAGMVERDKDAIFRTNKDLPLAVGFMPSDSDYTQTYGEQVSAKALTRKYGIDPIELPAGHPAWKTVGEAAVQMSLKLGLMTGVELVVVCGGVGAGASDKYAPDLNEALKDFAEHGGYMQKHYMPDILTVSSELSQTFELYGCEGVMRDHLTRDL